MTRESTPAANRLFHQYTSPAVMALPAAINGAGAVVIGLLALLLGLSNGLLTTAAMVAAPDSVEPRAAALCGNIMVLSLILGLCIGAASGFIWLL